MSLQPLSLGNTRLNLEVQNLFQLSWIVSEWEWVWCLEFICFYEVGVLILAFTRSFCFLCIGVLVLTSLRRHKIRCANSGIINWRETLLNLNSNPRLGGKLFESSIRPLILAGNIISISSTRLGGKHFWKFNSPPRFGGRGKSHGHGILTPYRTQARGVRPLPFFIQCTVSISRWRVRFQQWLRVILWIMNNIHYPMNTSPVDELQLADHLAQSHWAEVLRKYTNCIRSRSMYV